MSNSGILYICKAFAKSRIIAFFLLLSVSFSSIANAAANLEDLYSAGDYTLVAEKALENLRVDPHDSDSLEFLQKSTDAKESFDQANAYAKSEDYDKAIVLLLKLKLLSPKAEYLKTHIDKYKDARKKIDILEFKKIFDERLKRVYVEMGKKRFDYADDILRLLSAKLQSYQYKSELVGAEDKLASARSTLFVNKRDRDLRELDYFVTEAIAVDDFNKARVKVAAYRNKYYKENKYKRIVAGLDRSEYIYKEKAERLKNELFNKEYRDIERLIERGDLDAAAKKIKVIAESYIENNYVLRIIELESLVADKKHELEMLKSRKQFQNQILEAKRLLGRGKIIEAEDVLSRIETKFLKDNLYVSLDKSILLAKENLRQKAIKRQNDEFQAAIDQIKKYSAGNDFAKALVLIRKSTDRFSDNNNFKQDLDEVRLKVIAERDNHRREQNEQERIDAIDEIKNEIRSEHIERSKELLSDYAKKFKKDRSFDSLENDLTRLQKKFRDQFRTESEKKKREEEKQQRIAALNEKRALEAKAKEEKRKAELARREEQDLQRKRRAQRKEIAAKVKRIKRKRQRELAAKERSARLEKIKAEKEAKELEREKARAKAKVMAEAKARAKAKAKSEVDAKVKERDVVKKQQTLGDVDKEKTILTLKQNREQQEQISREKMDSAFDEVVVLISKDKLDEAHTRLDDIRKDSSFALLRKERNNKIEKLSDAILRRRMAISRNNLTKRLAVLQKEISRTPTESLLTKLAAIETEFSKWPSFNDDIQRLRKEIIKREKENVKQKREKEILDELIRIDSIIVSGELDAATLVLKSLNSKFRNDERIAERFEELSKIKKERDAKQQEQRIQKLNSVYFEIDNLLDSSNYSLAKKRIENSILEYPKDRKLKQRLSFARRKLKEKRENILKERKKREQEEKQRIVDEEKQKEKTRRINAEKLRLIKQKKIIEVKKLKEQEITDIFAEVDALVARSMYLDAIKVLETAAEKHPNNKSISRRILRVSHKKQEKQKNLKRQLNERVKRHSREKAMRLRRQRQEEERKQQQLLSALNEAANSARKAEDLRGIEQLIGQAHEKLSTDFYDVFNSKWTSELKLLRKAKHEKALKEKRKQKNEIFELYMTNASTMLQDNDFVALDNYLLEVEEKFKEPRFMNPTVKLRSKVNKAKDAYDARVLRDKFKENISSIDILESKGDYKKALTKATELLKEFPNQIRLKQTINRIAKLLRKENEAKIREKKERVKQIAETRAKARIDAERKAAEMKQTQKSIVLSNKEEKEKKQQDLDKKILEEFRKSIDFELDSGNIAAAKEILSKCKKRFLAKEFEPILLSLDTKIKGRSNELLRLEKKRIQDQKELRFNVLLDEASRSVNSGEYVLARARVNSLVKEFGQDNSKVEKLSSLKDIVARKELEAEEREDKLLLKSRLRKVELLIAEDEYAKAKSIVSALLMKYPDNEKILKVSKIIDKQINRMRDLCGDRCIKLWNYDKEKSETNVEINDIKALKIPIEDQTLEKLKKKVVSADDHEKSKEAFTDYINGLEKRLLDTAAPKAVSKVQKAKDNNQVQLDEVKKIIADENANLKKQIVEQRKLFDEMSERLGLHVKEQSFKAAKEVLGDVKQRYAEFDEYKQKISDLESKLKRTEGKANEERIKKDYLRQRNAAVLEIDDGEYAKAIKKLETLSRKHPDDKKIMALLRKAKRKQKARVEFQRKRLKRKVEKIRKERSLDQQKSMVPVKVSEIKEEVNTIQHNKIEELRNRFRDYEKDIKRAVRSGRYEQASQFYSVAEKEFENNPVYSRKLAALKILTERPKEKIAQDLLDRRIALIKQHLDDGELDRVENALTTARLKYPGNYKLDRLYKRYLGLLKKKNVIAREKSYKKFTKLRRDIEEAVKDRELDLASQKISDVSENDEYSIFASEINELKKLLENEHAKLKHESETRFVLRKIKDIDKLIEDKKVSEAEQDLKRLIARYPKDNEIKRRLADLEKYKYRLDAEQKKEFQKKLEQLKTKKEKELRESQRQSLNRRKLAFKKASGRVLQLINKGKFGLATNSLATLRKEYSDAIFNSPLVKLEEKLSLAELRELRAKEITIKREFDKDKRSLEAAINNDNYLAAEAILEELSFKYNKQAVLAAELKKLSQNLITSKENYNLELKRVQYAAALKRLSSLIAAADLKAIDLEVMHIQKNFETNADFERTLKQVELLKEEELRAKKSRVEQRLRNIKQKKYEEDRLSALKKEIDKLLLVDDHKQAYTELDNARDYLTLADSMSQLKEIALSVVDDEKKSRNSQLERRKNKFLRSESILETALADRNAEKAQQIVALMLGSYSDIPQFNDRIAGFQMRLRTLKKELKDSELERALSAGISEIESLIIYEQCTDARTKLNELRNVYDRPNLFSSIDKRISAIEERKKEEEFRKRENRFYELKQRVEYYLEENKFLKARVNLENMKSLFIADKKYASVIGKLEKELKLRVNKYEKLLLEERFQERLKVLNEKLINKDYSEVFSAVELLKSEYPTKKKRIMSFLREVKRRRNKDEEDLMRKHNDYFTELSQDINYFIRKKQFLDARNKFLVLNAEFAADNRFKKKIEILNSKLVSEESDYLKNKRKEKLDNHVLDVERMIQLGDIVKAKQLLLELGRSYPEEKRILTLQTDVEERLVLQKHQQRESLKQRLERIRKRKELTEQQRNDELKQNFIELSNEANLKIKTLLAKNEFSAAYSVIEELKGQAVVPAFLVEVEPLTKMVAEAEKLYLQSKADQFAADFDKELVRIRELISEESFFQAEAGINSLATSYGQTKEYSTRIESIKKQFLAVRTEYERKYFEKQYNKNIEDLELFIKNGAFVDAEKLLHFLEGQGEIDGRLSSLRNELIKQRTLNRHSKGKAVYGLSSRDELIAQEERIYQRSKKQMEELLKQKSYLQAYTILDNALSKVYTAEIRLKIKSLADKINDIKSSD